MPTKKTAAKKRKAGEVGASSSSSSSSSSRPRKKTSSSSSRSSSKKTVKCEPVVVTRLKRANLLPQNTPWMAPYFLPMGVGLGIEGYTQKHVVINKDIREGLKQYIRTKNTMLAKLREELEAADRYVSEYRGLQKNGGNAWAVMAATEGSGNTDREYIGTYDDEAEAALKWDHAMIEKNGLATSWKLNFPRDETSKKMLEDALAADVGKIMTWGGMHMVGQYKSTEYYGVYEVLASDDCDLDVYRNAGMTVKERAAGPSSSSSSSSSSRSSTKSKKEATLGTSKDLPADGEAWTTGQAAPFVAMARLGGRSTIIGKYSSKIEAACAYDEFADIVELPMNNVSWNDLKQARTVHIEAATSAFATHFNEKRYDMVKRSLKEQTALDALGDGKTKVVNLEQYNVLVKDAREGKKAIVKLEKLQSKIEKQKVREGGGKKAASKTKKTTGAKVGKQNV